MKKKQIKVVTSDFGITKCDVRKIFVLDDIEYAIVKMPYQYRQRGETYFTYRCIHLKSGGQIPTFSVQSKSLKGFIEGCVNTLNTIKKDLGEDEFYKQLNEWEIIN